MLRILISHLSGHAILVILQHQLPIQIALKFASTAYLYEPVQQQFKKKENKTKMKRACVELEKREV